VQGAPSVSVAFPSGQPVDGAEVRMLGNSRSLPFTWAAGTLRVELPDHPPAPPATAFELQGIPLAAE